MVLGLYICAGSCTRASAPVVPPAGTYDTDPRYATAPPPAQVRFPDVEFLLPKPRLYFGSMEQPMCGVNCECDKEKNYFTTYEAPESEWPCVVEAIVVFREIPEYRYIREEELAGMDISYHALLAEASRKFYEAIHDTLKALKARHGFLYDMVLEKGQLRLKDGAKARAIPEITGEALRRLDIRESQLLQAIRKEQ